MNMNGIQYLPEETERIYAPLEWHKLGRSQTATGYGNKLTTPYKVQHNGRLYRVYATCWSNAATCWIQSKGQKLYLRG
jgi:hypothetical protein